MTPQRPADDEIVQTAATAATNVIFSRYDHSAVRDFDVTVQFENERLEVDVYINADDDPERVADDAALAAQAAVDDLLE